MKIASLGYKNSFDDVDVALVYLNDEWNRLYGAGDHTSNNAVLNKSAKLVLKTVLHKLVGLKSYNVVPSFIVHKRSITINYSLDDINACTVKKNSGYQAILNQLDRLINAVGTDSYNNFGIFISAWNHVMSLEREHAPISAVSAYIHNYFNDHDFFYTPVKTYHDANVTLEGYAPMNNSEVDKFTPEQFAVIHAILTNSWHKFINKPLYKRSIAELVLHDVSKLARHGSKNAHILKFLSQFGIASGFKLQHDLMSSVDGRDFSTAHYCAVLASKITNPHKLYYDNMLELDKVRPVTVTDIILTIQAYKNSQKKLSALVNE